MLIYLVMDKKERESSRKVYVWEPNDVFLCVCEREREHSSQKIYINNNKKIWQIVVSRFLDTIWI